jgi:hypothetical protein
MEKKTHDEAFHLRASKQRLRRLLAHGFDRHIGGRIRQQRVLNGLSEQAMADLIGVSRKQVRKYKNGVNSVAARRLTRIRAKAEDECDADA